MSVDNISGKLCETHKHGAFTREWMVLNHREKPEQPSTMHVVGHTEARAGYEFVRRDPAFGVILVTESGQGRVLVGGRWVECGPGQAYVVSPRCLHAYHIGPGGHWKLHWVIYGERLAMPGLVSGAEPRVVELNAVSLRLSIEGLCHEKEGRADSRTMALWTELVDRSVFDALKLGQGEGRLERLWQALRADLSGAWTVRRMALLLGMGEENLRRLCQAQLGRPPMTELTRLRMEAASHLLHFSKEKVSSIGLRVGYADAFAFSTAFRRSTGLSPKAYRAKHGPSVF